MKVGEPIDHKHGSSFNSKTNLYQGWNELENVDPEYVFFDFQSFTKRLEALDIQVLP